MVTENLKNGENVLIEISPNCLLRGIMIKSRHDSKVSLIFPFFLYLFLHYTLFYKNENALLFFILIKDM
jgi:hypothetical protein